MAAIAAEGLTKHYPAGGRGSDARVIRALDDVDLEVREGEIFGFLGPNGAGKSTLIRLLLGYIHPTAGRATVLGLDAATDSVQIRGRVGYLPGGIALYDGLTGERHLDYLAELAGRPSVRRAELCDRLELDARTLRRPIRDYSRGMRQKIGIVQALQHDPELAILDEPSEGLDPLMQRAFYDVLDGLKAAGRTVFFSSHVLSEVERVCDRVAVVRSGRLVAVEDVGTLLARRRRRVELRLTGPAPDLAAVPGVSEIVIVGDTLTCALAGDPRPLLAAIATAPVADVLIEAASLEDAFLELYHGPETGAPVTPGGGHVISGPLLRHTWRAHRLRVLVLTLALGVWGFLMPVIYATFGIQMEAIIKSGIIPEAFLRLLGADPFSLSGAVALGSVHPVALGLSLAYPVGFAAVAIAGERQRGTLEVLLSRPISRRTVFATLLLAIATFALLTTTGQLLGTVLGAVAFDVADRLDPAQLAFLGLNTVVLLVALAAVCLAASSSFDRVGTPIAIGLAVVIGGYVLEVLGTLWPDAAFLQPYSPFHYLRPMQIMGGRAAPTDLLVLAAIGVAAIAFGLWRFPRRDLAAPT